MVVPLELDEVDEFEQLEMKQNNWEAWTNDYKQLQLSECNMDGEMTQR